jgi:hypothetical protein
MREIFTQASLANRSLPELRTLFRQVQEDLALCEIGSPDHFAAAQNLQTVRRAITMRTAPVPRR